MKLRDVDSSQTAHRIVLAVWAAVGAFIGGLFGFLAAGTGRWPASVTIGVGIIAGAVIVLLFAAGPGAAAGNAAATLFAPTGRSTRGGSELSMAESLVARGRYAEAAAEYRRQAENAPADAEPYLRLGRLHRDRLDDAEAAAAWFRQARAVAVHDAQEQLAVRELVELYERHMGEPTRALPELARLAELRAGTPAGDWAARELARIRAMPR